MNELEFRKRCIIDPNDSHPDFRKALELEPDQPDVLNYLGYSLVELGQKLGEAEKMIEKAVEVDADAMLNLWNYHEPGNVTDSSDAIASSASTSRASAAAIAAAAFIAL